MGWNQKHLWSAMEGGPKKYRGILVAWSGSSGIPGVMGHDDLPDAEFDLLAVLWNQGPATLRVVREALAERRPMTHGAAAVLMGRLEEKGLVERTGEKEGKAFVYRARPVAQGRLRARIEDLAQRLFGGDPIGLVSSLFGEKPPTAEQVADLERLLADLKRRRRRS